MISTILPIITVIVMSVYSADTLVVYDPVNKRSSTVIMASIDCPEQKQDYFWQSRAFVYGMLQNHKIGIRERAKTSSNTPLVDVYFGSLYVNEYLVKMGYCWSYFSSDDSFKEYEAQARKMGLGLWALPKPIPPWEFRRKFN